MQLSDAQAQLLKEWLIKKLDDVSDADSDVLADYVLALVKGGDGQPETLRAVCIENLRDFLQDGTEDFVSQVIETLTTQSYDPGHKPLPPTATTTTNAFPNKSKPAIPTGPSGSRKRAYDDTDGGRSLQLPHGPTFGDRPFKQLRRGGRGGRHGQQRPHDQQPFVPDAAFPPAMNMQDALGALVSMQQAMGLPPLPGMEQFATGMIPQPNRDGASFDMPASRGQRGGGRARGGGGGGGGGGGAHNARRPGFGTARRNDDKSNTTVVVEQIPDDKFNDHSVREFFNQFGTIKTVDLQPYKRSALITFDNWDQANSAYNSPKVIFDNRFVKVFWHRPNTQQNGHANAATYPTATGGDVEMKTAEPEIDHEELARRQEEAQRKHDEAKQAREEAAKQKQDINAKVQALEVERKKMADLLARKAAKTSATTATADKPAESPQPETEQTKALKAQLAKLEAEAKSLGIDPAVDDANSNSAWSGRGGFRGRGSFAPRGRGAFRGAWSAASARGGAVKRLDNRPKTLAVVFPKGKYDDFDEAMRQYLLFTDNLEHATLSKHPERQDAAVVAFEERYRAENFMAAVKGPNGIPNIGTVETIWVPSPPLSLPSAAVAVNGSSAGSTIKVPAPSQHSAKPQDTKMEGVETNPAEGGLNMDVAEDDQWD